MTKKGFTLMELLVSIFISGMVMLALVAMWRTSSNHTVQAQRQSIVRNESTIFLRKIYSDFISASEIICPWSYTANPNNVTCGSNVYLAVKEAVLDPNDSSKLVRVTDPVCGEDNNEWDDQGTVGAVSSRCTTPTFTVYCYKSGTVFRHNSKFLDGTTRIIAISSLIDSAVALCNDDENNGEVIMPYLTTFNMEPNTMENNGGNYPDLRVEYTVRRQFSDDIPDIYFKFERSLTRKRGV